MTFIADDFLEKYISKKRRESFFGVLFGVFLFIVLAGAFYYNTSSILMLRINLIVTTLIVGSFIYSATVMEGRKLNKIVKELIVDDEIFLSTYSYRFLFYNLTSQGFRFKKEDIKLEEVKFPFNSSGLSNNKTYCVNNEGVKIYICYECFSEKLLVELNRLEILNKADK